MPTILDILEPWFFSFILILVRVSSFFVTAPVFGGTGVPTQAKVGLAGLMSAILLISTGPLNVTVPDTVPSGMVLIAGEVAFGLVLGYSVSLVFAGIQLGGMLIGYQMGFAIANVLDPISNDQVSIVGQFLFLFALLYFLTMDAHHVLIKGIFDSYTLAQPGTFAVSQISVFHFVEIFARMFWLGLKIAMPVVGAIFLVDVALGIVAKTVPQMNVFIVGLPLKSLLGMFILALAYPFFALVMRFDFQYMSEGLYKIMRVL